MAMKTNPNSYAKTTPWKPVGKTTYSEAPRSNKDTPNNSTLSDFGPPGKTTSPGSLGMAGTGSGSAAGVALPHGKTTSKGSMKGGY